jgi:hypothetical protein
MMKFFRKFQVHFIIAILGFFVLSIAVGFGTGMLDQASPLDAVAEVDLGRRTDEIPVYVFLSRYNRAMAQVPSGTPVDKSFQDAKRQEVMQELVQDSVFADQSRKLGIHVPDRQVVSSLAQVPLFQENGAFSPQAYGRALQYQLHTTPKEFEEEQRNAIARFKLNWLIRSCIKMTDAEYDMAYAVRGAEIERELKKDRKPAELANLKDQVREQLLQQKIVSAFELWFRQLGERIKVTPHLERLQGLS